MSAHARRRQHQGVLWTIALAAMVTGAVLLTLALRAQVGAPVAQSAGRIDPPGPAASAPPSASGSPGTARTEPSDGPTPARRQGPAPLGASPPRTISIPAIGLTSKVNPIGLAEDGSIAVPQPGPLLDQAAWFENSPTPGQPGPSVIEGHVDTESGPSVFFELGTVEPGQQVLVTRKDGRRLTFVVDAVRDYLKSEFPTEVVYGAKDLSVPALRLITCSQFDTATRHHVGNQVVFARLTKVDGRSLTR